ncbi:hypothetical protein GEMRC1_002538 [Eukaryota sp. GEM-RC1]
MAYNHDCTQPGYHFRPGDLVYSKVAEPLQLNDLWSSPISDQLPKPLFSPTLELKPFSSSQYPQFDDDRFIPLDLSKLRILRDYFQLFSILVGLSGITKPSHLSETLWNVFSFTPLTFQSFPPLAIVTIVFFLSFYVSIKLLMTKIETFYGHLPKQFRKFSLLAQVSQFLLTSLSPYITQSTLVVLSHNWKHLFSNIDISPLLLLPTFLLINLYFPYLWFKLISKSKPRPKYFDSEGKPKQYTRDDYQSDLSKSPSPNLFLCHHLDLGRSNYDVCLFIIKTVTVLVSVLFHGHFISCCLFLIVSTLLCISSFYICPYISVVNTAIDRVFMTSLTVSAVVVALNPFFQNSFVSSSILVLIVVSLFCFVSVLLYHSPRFVTFVRCIFGHVKFSRADKDWDLQSERKLRIWTPFWHNLFSSSSSFLPCLKRLRECSDTVVDLGCEQYKKGLRVLTEEEAHNRGILASELEGVDVCYRPELINFNGSFIFGKLWIKSFPFSSVFVPDELTDWWFLNDSHYSELIKLNQDPAVLKIKNIRRQLRCLHGERVHFDHSCEKLFQIIKDTSTTRVSVPVNYSKGILSIVRNRPSQWSAGFRVSIRLIDGRGSSKDKEVVGDEHVLGHSQLGIEMDFKNTEILEQLLSHPSNAKIIEKKLPLLEQKEAEYRKEMIEMRAKTESVLSFGFWYFVYTNDKMTRVGLEHYLENFEHNPALKNLVSDRNFFDFLYSQLSVFNHHPAFAYWFVFWMDFWENNDRLRKVKRNQHLFSPICPQSLMYHPCCRNEVEKLLESIGLKRSLMKHLDQLYCSLHRLSNHPVSL